MDKCIIIPDSFKGTMSSIEVCRIISEELKTVFPNCKICSIPIADGGEGTVDCYIHALHGTKVMVDVTGPFGETVKSFYGRIGNIAVIEMAAAAGLGLAYGRMDPLKASTYGVGELIRHAVENGCAKLILGLGGSCSNDGGAGMAAALGTKFYAADGTAFVPSGGTLREAVRIDNTQTEMLLRDIEIEAMCDINNPMFGPTGAAHVFGPQKGADQETVDFLDQNLRRFSSVIEKSLGVNVSGIPGSGAAGAMGAGVYAFLGGTLVSGIELLLDTVGFDQLLDGCDVVFTGEGKLDSQSFHGKVIAGVTKHAKKYHVPVIAISGCAEEGILQGLEEQGIRQVWTVYDQPVSLPDILPYCRADLRNTVRALAKSLS